MATSGFLKVDRSSLKTVAMKETPFNASDFPTKAKDAYNYIANPNSQEEVSVTKPQLNSTIGVKLGADTNTSLTTASWGGFIERPANKRGYYFPLDSNLNGYDLQDMIEDSYENKIKAYLKDHPEVVPEGYKPTFVEGRDVCWNQLIEPSSFYNSESYGVRYCKQADGTILITEIGTRGETSYSDALANAPSVIAGHVYLSCGMYDDDYKVIGFTGQGALSIATCITSGQIDLRFSIPTTLALPIRSMLGLVDLTQMFGSGNEPTSVTDPRIADIKAYLAEHPEYNEGTIVNNNVTEVRSEGANLFDGNCDHNYYRYTDGNIQQASSRYLSFPTNYGKFRIKKGQTVTQSFKTIDGRPWLAFVIFNTDGSYKDSVSKYGTEISYTATDDCDVSAQIYSSNNETNVYGRVSYDWMIEMSDVAHDYTPYRPPINLTLPPICQDLHGLPSDRDRLSFVNKIYENMKSVDLSTLAWGSVRANRYYVQIPDLVHGGVGICDTYGVQNVDAPGLTLNCMNVGYNQNYLQLYCEGTPHGILHYEATSGGERYEARVLERKVEMVDLGSLPASVWTYNNVDYGSPVLYTTNGLFRKAKGYDILCSSKYSVVASESWTAMADKSITGSRSAAYIAIKDTSMTSKEQFLASISGVMLLYPLSAPQLLDVTEVVPMKPAEERIPNIVGSFSTGYENDGLCTYEGAFPSRTSIVNLIDNSTVKNNWVNAVVSVIGHTPINARDGISILPSNMSNDTRRTFSFTPTTTGKYHFSFYARLSGDARSYSSSSLRGISLTISPNPTASYDIAAPRLIRGSNIYNLEYEWNRYGKCISLNANTTYTITLNWYASNNWRRPDTPLKICGVLLESGSFLSPYDVKGTDINGTGRSITSVIRPLFFNLARLDGALEDPTKSWMVTYLRKINTNSQATGSNTHGDNFGIGNYGYSGNNILGGTSTGEQASDYYNCWEKVIFYHKANEDEFKYEVFNTETNKHYSIVRSDSSITHQTVGNIQYNLSLGTLVASSSLQESDNAQYRDLLYVPNVTEEEYLAEINKYFEVEKVRMTYEKTGEDPITVTDALTIKKTNLLEGSTLEY